MEENLIGTAALIIAILTFISTQWGMRRVATKTYVERLEHRIEKLEAELKECVTGREELRRQNIALTEKIAANA